MRNLKKILALVLALMMTLSLMVTASASTYKDTADSDYSTAIEVMSGIGVFNGSGAGNFNPTGTLKRDAAAKIIAYMKLGKVVADELPKDIQTFSDVKVGNWANGAITWCYNQGIIDGVGNGKFSPNGTLTGYQFGKMLLNAAGIEGKYTGSGWTLNVASALNTNKITAGMKGLALGQPLTREQACQMAFNALNYTPDGGTTEYVVFTDEGDGAFGTGDTLHYRGTDPITALLMQSANAGAKLVTVDAKVGSIGDTVYSLKEETASDDFGRPATEWTNGQMGTARVVYASVKDTPVLSYTKGTTYGKIASALGYTSLSDSLTFTEVLNGFAKSPATGVNRNTATAVGGTGTLVEVYQTGAAAYKIVVVETFVQKLTASDIKKATPATAIADAKDAYIEVGTKDVEYTTTAFKAGDVILYTVKTSDGTEANATKVVNVVKADYVTGTVNAIGASNAYIRVNGVQYFPSANKDSSSMDIGTSATCVLNATSTFYKDFYGNLIYASATPPADVDVSYIYVIEVRAQEAKSVGGSDLFGTGATSAEAKAQAKVIDLKTGEIKVVDLALGKDNTGADFFLKTDGTLSTNAVDEDNVAQAGEKVYKYAMVDGKVALDGITGETAQSITTAPGTETIATKTYANSSTVLTVVEYTKTGAAYTSAKVSTHVGYKNFPTIATADGYYTANATTGAVANVLVVKPASDAATPVNYAIYKGEGEETSNGTAQEFYVGGEVKSYIDNDDYSTGTTAWAANTVYDLTVGNNTLDGTVVSANKTAQTVKYITDTYVVVTSGGTDTTYPLASGCEVYDGTAGANYAAVELAEGDTVSVYVDSNTAANLIIITAHAS